MSYLKLIDAFKEDLKVQVGKIDKNTALKIAAGGLFGCGVLYGLKIWYSYKYFEKRGIKTPQYKFISGNLNEVLEKNYSDALHEWTKTYGKVYGYYEGHLPIHVTSDLAIIEEVFFKQFANFTARKKAPIQVSEDSPKLNLVFASKNRWKRLRTIINPTFSPAKLKELVPHMDKCSNRLVAVIEKNLDREINISDYFDRMTMDVVWNGAYGIDIDFQSNPDYPFFVRTIENFKNISDFNLFFKLMVYFYELKFILIPLIETYTWLASKISSRLGNPFFWIIQQIHKVLDERLKTKIIKKDYLQILVDSQSDEAMSSLRKHDNENYDPSGKLIEKKMTYDELIMNLVIFLFAGFETTSVTLSYCVYYLAKYPEEMARLQAEIDSLDVDQFDYENIQKLQYLDMFIKELQRMRPIGNAVVHRRCTEDTQVGNLKFQKGDIIAVDVLSLHYNPEYWGDVDPNIFYPERFSPSNHINKLAYMPFGLGPRICVGMKFALLEIKLTLAKLLKKYDFVAPPGGLADLVIKEGAAIRRPRNGIRVVVKRRETLAS